MSKFVESFEAILGMLSSNWQRKERGEDIGFCCAGAKVNNTLDPFVRKVFFVSFHFICLFLPFFFVLLYTTVSKEYVKNTSASLEHIPWDSK